jgi:hypothetical protein
MLNHLETFFRIWSSSLALARGLDLDESSRTTSHSAINPFFGNNVIRITEVSISILFVEVRAPISGFLKRNTAFCAQDLWNHNCHSVNGADSLRLLTGRGTLKVTSNDFRVLLISKLLRCLLISHLSLFPMLRSLIASCSKTSTWAEKARGSRTNSHLTKHIRMGNRPH